MPSSLHLGLTAIHLGADSLGQVACCLCVVMHCPQECLKRELEQAADQTGVSCVPEPPVYVPVGGAYAPEWC